MATEVVRNVGIVVPAGGPYLIRQEFANLHVLRGLGCQLPVELFHIGPDEVTSKVAQAFAHIGVEVIDILNRLPDELEVYLDGSHTRRFFVLPMALVASSFSRLLLLAADVTPLVDLSPWAFGPQDLTAQFWPWHTQPPHASHEMWEAAGVTKPACPGCHGLCTDAWELDSGMVWVDKQGCPEGVTRLLALIRMPSLRVMHEGDQDLFQMAWRHAKCRFEIIRQFPGFAGFKDINGTFHGLASVHLGPLGNPLSVHVQMLKHAEKTVLNSLRGVLALEEGHW